jgi:hypothetical protein
MLAETSPQLIQINYRTICWKGVEKSPCFEKLAAAGKCRSLLFACWGNFDHLVALRTADSLAGRVVWDAGLIPTRFAFNDDCHCKPPQKMRLV